MPPRPSVEELATAYAAEVATKRRRFIVAVAGLALMVFMAGWIAEIRLDVFFANIHKFPNYIARLFVLDSGPMAGRFVLLDIRWLCAVRINLGRIGQAAHYFVFSHDLFLVIKD